VGTTRQPAANRVEPAAVEPKAIDDRPVLVETEQPRFGIARLPARRDGADLGKAEAEAEDCVGDAGILVIARGQSDRVGEVASPQALRQDRRLWLFHPRRSEEPAQAELEHPQAQLVRGLRRQRM